jgi:hypothetical protein
MGLLAHGVKPILITALIDAGLGHGGNTQCACRREDDLGQAHQAHSRWRRGDKK